MMRAFIALSLGATVLLSGCGQPAPSVGSNIADAHDNAADAIENKADALDNQADATHAQAEQTRKWGKDLKKEADKIQDDGGHPDEKALNQM